MPLLLTMTATIAAVAQEPLKKSAAAVNRSAAAVGQQAGSRAASAPATEDRAAAAAPVYGRLTGRVTSDDGRPLTNIVVLVRAVGSLTPAPPRVGGTDANGKFEFVNLASGAYTAQPLAPGYVLLRDPEEAAERPEHVYYHLGDQINLTMTKGGVITGTVTDATGQAMVAMRVHVVRVRDALGRPLRTTVAVQDMQTDDRGVYRVWGLEPGGYLVSAGGESPYFENQSPFREDAPTYYPSATRDGATEVTVRYGDEQSNIDIRYRNERGHRVSGTVSGATESSNKFYGGIAVYLIHVGSGLIDETSYVWPSEGNSFTLSSVADGEYDLVAQRGLGGDSATSPPRRIKVKGTDLTGLQLVLAPLGTITGRVLMEATPSPTPPACEAKPNQQALRQRALEETVILARLDERSSKRVPSPLPITLDTSPKSNGEFAIGGLQPGHYRLDVRPPDDRWYVRAITMSSMSAVATPASAGTQSRPAASAKSNNATAAAAAAPTSPAASTRATSAIGSLEADGSLLIGPGTQATGVTITLVGGASKLTGRVVPSVEGASLPPRLRLYLVPREAESADDVLRFGEVTVRNDGAFTLANLAPGRYWLLARPAPDTQTNDPAPVPLAWNREARTDLRRNAEAARQEIELQPCQQLTGVTVRHAPPAPPNK